MTDPQLIEHYWERLRYEPEQQEDDGSGRQMWRIVDHHNGGAHVQGELDMDGTVGVLEFALVDSAQAWISRVRHMTEGAPNAGRR